MSSSFTDVDRLCVNTIRTLSIDAIENAKSGHPGLPLGAAPMAYVLFDRHLAHSPSHPDWADRDRFVLSAGHGSALLYSLLHLFGYGLSLDDLRAFRQRGSLTPGHPESFITAGVEATTGPLGQGSANVVGMAMAERHLAGRFNRDGRTLIDHRSYALVSDGDLMEGISAEAASLAGHLGLGKLICLYDANDVSLDGPNHLAFDREDVARRYEAYGWQVQRVDDGDHDLDGIDRALSAAREETERPSLIIVKTTIGYGSPNKGGSAACHGAPLGEDEVRLVKEALGWDPSAQFHVPEEAAVHFARSSQAGADRQGAWQTQLREALVADSVLATDWHEAFHGELPEGWDAELPNFEIGSSVATRVAAGKALNALARRVPWLLGGDADLSGSTKTALAGESSFDATTGTGRNIHFGVREHAMAAIANGMCYHEGLRPYVATFFCFADYMRPSIRLAALSGLSPIYVWTHDSLGVGEDGPTHQPVEHLMSLRIIPELVILRPGDATEAAEAWRWALASRGRPVGLVLSRQDLPVLERAGTSAREGLSRGAYVLADVAGERPDVILIGTGSELHLAVEARSRLAEQGIAARVVSMPSWELFAEQDAAYRDSILPPALRARVSVEAGVSLGWERWIGDRGVAIAQDRFGASAPGDQLLEEMGFSTTAVVEAAKHAIERAQSAS